MQSTISQPFEKQKNTFINRRIKITFLLCVLLYSNKCNMRFVTQTRNKCIIIYFISHTNVGAIQKYTDLEFSFICIAFYVRLLLYFTHINKFLNYVLIFTYFRKQIVVIIFQFHFYVYLDLE